MLTLNIEKSSFVGINLINLSIVNQSKLFELLL